MCTDCAGMLYLHNACYIEYRSNDVTKNFFLDFSVLDTIYRWSMMKNIHSPNWVGIGSWGPEIWLHEYLSPIEISVNWPVPNSYEPGQFTLISMGLIRYSCGHISGHHEPFHVKFGVWGFFIMFYWNIVMKMLKCKKCKKKKIWWRHTSVLYVHLHIQISPDRQRSSRIT